MGERSSAVQRKNLVGFEVNGVCYAIDILQVRDKHDTIAIILVEHEMGVIERITDRCVVLNFGRKIAEGRYRDVAADRQVQEAYLGAVP